ncbi:nitroreductase family protein [bacterium]|nr:nitroreductase family protein [bacterium]
MNFKEMAEARFSVRSFSDRPIEKEKLDKILEAVRLAPTAKNQQPQKVYVLQSQEALAKMRSLSPCVYGANTVLIFTYSKKEEWNNPLQAGIHSGVEDVSIAATYVMLQAIELGIYTTWCNYFGNDALKAAFALPEDEEVVLFMPLGYKAENSAPSPAHAATKELKDMIRYL